MIKEEGLRKIANSDPEVKKALFILSKLAAGNSEKPTQFNESVPSAEKEDKEGKPEGEGQGEQQAPKEAVPVGPIAQPVPTEGASGDPAVDGARAAQAFMQPAFEAASTGDETAQRTIAMAAGEVARGVAEATGKNPAAEMPPEVAMAPAPISPEEQAANQIVAQPQQAPPQAMGQGAPMSQAPGQGAPMGGGFPGQYKQSSDQTISMDTAVKLVKMAKMNII